MWDRPLHRTLGTVSGEGCYGKTHASQHTSSTATHKGLAAQGHHWHICACVCVCASVRCGWLHPSFLTILMSLRSTLVAVLGSMTFMTASTAMGASWEEYWDTTWWEEVT